VKVAYAQTVLSNDIISEVTPLPQSLQVNLSSSINLGKAKFIQLPSCPGVHKVRVGSATWTAVCSWFIQLYISQYTLSFCGTDLAQLSAR